MLLPLSEHLSSKKIKLDRSQKNINIDAAINPDLRKQIFVATDNHDLREKVRQGLGSDLRVTIGMPTEEGLTRFANDPPELILCDINSKLKSLIEFLKHNDFADIPVLAMVTDNERRKAAAWIGNGVSDILNLPIEGPEFLNRIQFHLQQRLARKALQIDPSMKSKTLVELAEDMALKNREFCRTSRLKDDFMAMLSHELRNPINVISGFAEVLLSNSDDPELAHEAAQAIYRNAQFQVKLVQDLMDISRSIAGKMVLECKPLELGLILKEVLPTAQSAADNKGIKLHVHVKSSGLTHGDPIRLSQVVWNLVSNAIKFTPQGGRIDIEIQNHTNDIEFSVRDTGVGIDQDFLPYIFEQFHQQDNTITKNFGGLGLGLAIVKHIIELHRGTVSAHSDGVGHGATFIVRLPSLPN